MPDYWLVPAIWTVPPIILGTVGLFSLYLKKKQYLKLKKENDEYAQKKEKQQQAEIKHMDELLKTD